MSDVRPSPKAEAIQAIDRAIGLMPKDGAMTPLDSSLMRVALGHAREMVDDIEELKQPRRSKKATQQAKEKS